MRQSTELNDRLDQLRAVLAGHPRFVDQVMSEITKESTCNPIEVEQPERGGIQRFAALAIAAAIIFAIGWWMTRSTSLYAQAIAALQKVEVVHASGWTKELVRKWPLENEIAAQEERYNIEAWYWNDGERNGRAHETIGPITTARDGAILTEFQRDVELLYVLKSKPKDSVERFETLGKVLKALAVEGTKTIDLGALEVDGKVLQGTRMIRDAGIEEYWFDSQTKLPMIFTRSRKVDQEMVSELELKLSYDDPLPETIEAYSPPASKNMRYGGQVGNVVEVWDQHVQNLQVAIATQPDLPLPRIIERTGQKTFSYQYGKLTPNGRLRIIPLDLKYSKMDVGNFIRLHVSGAGDESDFYRWRIERNLEELTFPKSDLVSSNKTPWQEWTSFALGTIGLDFITVEEDREFWIAKHNGVNLKSYKEVNPPVPYIVEGGREKRGLVNLGVGHALRPVSLQRLFDDFNTMQNMSPIGGHHPIIIDQTGFPQPPEFDKNKYESEAEYEQEVNYEQYLVASDSPYFVGEGSTEMARQWYQKELGITFDSEIRKLTMHIVRQKK